jgi:uncharacterized protein with FMN-binding domain
MKRIALAAISTLAALVALFSYPTSTGRPLTTAAEAVTPATVLAQPGTGSATTTGQGPDPSTGSTTSSESSSESSSSGAPSTSTSQSSSESASAGPVTVDGAAEMTRYGAVQVQVVISDGKITDVVAVQYPQQNGRDQEINSQAIPLLRDQVLSAQSAQVDGVSGATFTSEGYLASVQSALDAAGFTK